MSHSGSVTPQSHSHSSNAASTKAKAQNVFSNDGSFLERFYRTKREEEEKKKQEQTLETKRNFEDRFKRRGKRPLPDDASPAVTDSTDSDQPSKKTKTDKPAKPLTKYEEEVSKSTPKTIKDQGTGVRPMVK